MKIKAIASLFSKNNRLIIHTDENGSQWLSNGHAMYSISGLPTMNKDAILRMFDVPEDKRAKWLCEEIGMPEVINTSNDLPFDEQIEPLKTRIDWMGNTYRLFLENPLKIHAIREDYIKPLLDEKEYITYWKRATKGGYFMLAVKNALFLQALIAPALIHCNEDHNNEIQQIAGTYSAMLENEYEKRVEDLSSYIWGTILENNQPTETEPSEETQPDDEPEQTTLDE
jgi:hypothetical protein